MEPSFPDVTPKTHIIGLCGVSDFSDPETGRNAADPREDGWMVSDFYLLQYLLDGTGASQAWFTCHDPKSLIARYGEYLHGNSYRERKVVLDINQQPNLATLRVESPDGLLPSFLSYFRAECAVASKVKEPVLLCVFCHGEARTYGLEIGGTEEEGPILSIEAISKVIPENNGLDVSLLMTSCFSGGWTISSELRDENNHSRATVMTAAGPDMVSESWPKTESLGRTCGSIYISSVIKNLAIKEQERNPGQTGTPLSTKDFAAAITYQLLNVVDPRFGLYHDHRFEAQQSRWGEPYPKRTGIPQSDYYDRLQALRVVPPRSPSDIRLDRSATQDEVDSWELAHPDAPHVLMAASNYGGSLNAVKREIRIQAKAYMRSFPGRDSLAPNHRPHNLIHMCIQTPQMMTDSAWAGTWEILHYRMQAVETAEKLARRMGIQAPKASCWNMDDWLRKNVGTENHKQASQYYRQILLSGLIPPKVGSRNPYYKALWYLAANVADCGLPPDEMFRRFKELEKSKSQAAVPMRFTMHKHKLIFKKVWKRRQKIAQVE